jgi:hypothetical protein
MRGSAALVTFSREKYCLSFFELALGSGNLCWCWNSWGGGDSRIAGFIVAWLATLE